MKVGRRGFQAMMRAMRGSGLCTSQVVVMAVRTGGSQRV